MANASERSADGFPRSLQISKLVALAATVPIALMLPAVLDTFGAKLVESYRGLGMQHSALTSSVHGVALSLRDLGVGGVLLVSIVAAGAAAGLGRLCWRFPALIFAMMSLAIAAAIVSCLTIIGPIFRMAAS